MTSGIASKGVDLDDVFDPWQTGTSKARTTGISVAGSDINNRFAPLVYGTSAPATGIQSQGADLNTLFAAKGTAKYSIPIDGQRYTAGSFSDGVAPIKPCNGTIFVQIGGDTINVQTKVVNNGGTPIVNNNDYSIPEGANYFQITTSGVTITGNASQTNLASDWTAIPGSLTTELTFTASQSNNTGTSEISGSVTVNFGTGQSTIWTGTCTLDASADISA